MNNITETEAERILALKADIRQDYERNSQTKKIFSYEISRRDDPAFITVGYRPLVDRIWFSDLGHYPAYGSLGGTIARGELDYVLSKIRQNVIRQQGEIPIVREAEFNMDWVRANLELLAPEQDRISLVGSVENLYQKIINQQNWKASFDNTLGEFKIDVDGFSIPLYPVAKDIVKNNIILINRDCCSLTFREFTDPVSNTRSTLFVEIKPYEENPLKMDILVYSTLKFVLCNPNLVRMFSFESAEGQFLII